MTKSRTHALSFLADPDVHAFLKTLKYSKKGPFVNAAIRIQIPPTKEQIDSDYRQLLHEGLAQIMATLEERGVS